MNHCTTHYYYYYYYYMIQTDMEEEKKKANKTKVVKFNFSSRYVRLFVAGGNEMKLAI